MNYLAHLYLAETTPASLLGNLVADAVKGRDVAALPADVQRGVRLHRLVDSFTDSHPAVQRSITRISERWGWFSGILIDVYYDHILAAEWERYSAEPLRDFTDRVHRCLWDNIDLLPGEGRELVGKLIASDRLFTYATPEGIADALTRLSRRVRERIPKAAVKLEEALPNLQTSHAALAADFHEFFPKLIAFVREKHSFAEGCDPSLLRR
jgi:acyl carrier protein phosphodiesterase